MSITSSLVVRLTLHMNLFLAFLPRRKPPKGLQIISPSVSGCRASLCLPMPLMSTATLMWPPLRLLHRSGTSTHRAGVLYSQNKPGSILTDVYMPALAPEGHHRAHRLLAKTSTPLSKAHASGVAKGPLICAALDYVQVISDLPKTVTVLAFDTSNVDHCVYSQ